MVVKIPVVMVIPVVPQQPVRRREKEQKPLINQFLPTNLFCTFQFKFTLNLAKMASKARQDKIVLPEIAKKK